MRGEDASGGARVWTRTAPRPRTRLVACFVFALGLHVVVLASRLARGRPVASRRSAGGLQAIEFADCTPESPRPPLPPGATVPPAPAPRRRDVGVADRTAGVTRARARDVPPRVVAFEATSAVVALSTSGAARGPQGAAFEAGQHASLQDAAVVSRAHTEHGRPHGPRLLTTGVCGGFFPSQARDDDGAVIVALSVHESGTPYATRIIAETPPRQGFGGAALRCASLLKFAPAESAAGAHVSSTSVVRLRFARARAK